MSSSSTTTPRPPPSASKILKTEPLSPTAAKWTSLHLTTYLDPAGHTRTWEHASRPTRPANSAIDGVGIVAILPRPGRPEIILQKQFRPPVGKVVVEIPAGLVDEGEDAGEAGVRELREETGYHGEIEEGGVGVVMFNDPGFCDTNLQMVHVAVDEGAEENQVLRTELEENEFIEVFTVKLAELWGECRRLEGEGLAIDARVGTLADGIELARKWKL